MTFSFSVVFNISRMKDFGTPAIRSENMEVINYSFLSNTEYNSLIPGGMGGKETTGKVRKMTAAITSS
jgi:hypothetical protein